MFRLLLLFAIWFHACSASAAIGTEKRVALIIGNGSYHVGALPNAINDSILIDMALKDVGFETILLQDATQKEMELTIRGFSEMLKNADVGLFYYAGHAIEVYGENYLIPVDVKDLKAELIKYDAVNVGQMMDTMEASESPINIMVLDACRDNPFRSFSRSASRGLAPMNSSAQGLFVAFSTAPGRTATDGAGRNSPYTKALAKYIGKPGISIHEVFSNVRAQVIDETGSQQVPWESHSLIGNFFFSGKNNDKEEIARLKRQVEAFEKFESENQAAVEAARTERERVANKEKEQAILDAELKDKAEQEERARLSKLQQEKKRIEKEARVRAEKEEQRRIAEIQSEKEHVEAAARASDEAKRIKIAKVRKEQEERLRKEARVRAEKEEQRRIAEIQKEKERIKAAARAREVEEQRIKIARIEQQKEQEELERKEVFELQQLVSSCEQYVRKKEMKPALRCYKGVLARKPGYSKAVVGVQSIGDYYEKALTKALKEKHLDTAKNTYTLLDNVDSKRASSYKKKVERLESKQSKKKIRMIPTF